MIHTFSQRPLTENDIARERVVSRMTLHAAVIHLQLGLQPQLAI